MRKFFKLKVIVLSLGFFIGSGCTNLDEELFNKISPDNFYNTIDDVAAGIARVYEHTSWAIHTDVAWWRVSELSSDHFVWTQKGRHGYDEARWIQLHGHSWNYHNKDVFETWRSLYQGIGYAYNMYRDLEQVIKPEADKFGMTVNEVEEAQAEMLVLGAMYHMYILEAFGPKAPLFTPEMGGDEYPPASTGTQLFDFIETTFKDNIDKLGQHQAGTKDKYYGRIDQATAAAFLARLYLNAGVTTGTERFNDCATICQNILNGNYGHYALDADWQQQFNYDNDKSTAILWAFPCEKNQLRRTTLPCNNHYQAKYFFRSEQGSGCNGVHLQPSQTTDGRFFEDMYGQGSPYQKFYDGDERRVPFFCEDNGTRYGQFLIGTMSVPGETYSGLAAFDYASEEWKLTEKADTIYCVDRVGRFSEIVNAWEESGDPRYAGLVEAHNFLYVLENATPEELASVSSDFAEPGKGVTKGEENSGFRQNKYPIYPDAFEAGAWNYNSDYGVVRLAEIYFMLAECKFRAGQVAEAAQLLDEVRRPYFTQKGADEAATREAKLAAGKIDDIREPAHSYLTATTETGDVNKYWNAASYVQNPELLTADELLDAWGAEFMGEGRRRMDLRRFDKFTKGRWWNKNVDTDPKSELFPIPQRALNANKNLEQNEGYQSL